MPLVRGCEPETNLDFKELLRVARERAQEPHTTPEAIGEAVIERSKKFV